MRKIFIDSNIFIRHLTHDDPRLSPKATKFFKDLSEGQFVGYISVIVLHEVTYVLRKGYNLEEKRISGALITLLRMENLKIVDMPKETVLTALTEYGQHSVDLADIFYKHIALNNGCLIASFDRDMQKIGAPFYKM